MIKILNSNQIREADAYTIAHEPIASIDLMERASVAFCDWLMPRISNKASVTIVCGTGNNGGDGLAIARILQENQVGVELYIAGELTKGSADFSANLERIKQIRMKVHTITSETDIHDSIFEKSEVLIDGLFGSGLSRPLTGMYGKLVACMNATKGMKVAIDIASGLFADKPMLSSWVAFQPDFTISFELPKLAFFRPDNEPFVGMWVTVPIGLDRQFITNAATDFHLLERADVSAMVRPRKKFSHKGTYGHTLLIAGSRGKMGAAVLAAKACLRGGVGLLTVYCPGCGCDILQTTVPEAMVITDPHPDWLTTLPDIEKYSTIAIGPGIGVHEETKQLLGNLLVQVKQPLVIDADGLNLLASLPEGIRQLPPETILTPHPKEFARIMKNLSFETYPWDALRQISKEYKLNIVLKGAYSGVCDPIGVFTFNPTGNAGMATGGSGDVLTGLVAALLSQGYMPSDALRAAVYLHGMAADLAIEKQSVESLIASDIVEYLGSAYQKTWSQISQ